MKRLIAGALLLGVSFVSVSPSMVSAATPPDSCFAFSSGTITDYYDHEGNNAANPACPRDVDIPGTIGGVPVTAIGSSAFASNQLTAATVPSSVVTIGSSAFTSNNLTSFVIPDTVTSVGSSAFSSNDITQVTLSNSMTIINSNTFYDNKLTSIEIPESVTTIGANAFWHNDLTALGIPDTVTTIGNGAFYGNLLEIVGVGTGLTSIGDYSFAFNKITWITLPSGITDIPFAAFFGQNPYGHAIDRSTNPDYDLWSSDMTAVKAAYDSIWYVRVYTSDPSNPNNLSDKVTTEYYWIGDQNENGTEDDVIGGHLINPARVTLSYQKSDGSDVQQPMILVGQNDQDLLFSYRVNEGPVVPAPADVFSPTAAETQAITGALGVYYRVGDEITLTAPDVEGYDTPVPATQTFVLGLSDNELSFVYGSAETNEEEAPSSGVEESDDMLAETGMNSQMWAGFALVLASTSIALVRKRRETQISFN